MLDVPPLDPSATQAATYLSAVIHALAREEHQGRRPLRLLEPDHATWNRFRGRLGARDLVELLLEDAAVTQAEPFSAAAVLDAPDALDAIPESLIGDWLTAVPKLPLAATAREYIESQAVRLGLTARLALGDLRRIQPHDRVLELPGTGGRIAAHLLQTQPGLSLSDIFTIACGTWQERVLAGLVAVESGTVGEVRILLDPTLAQAKGTGITFSLVFGVKPEKGGLFTETRVSELLQKQAPDAPILL